MGGGQSERPCTRRRPVARPGGYRPCPGEQVGRRTARASRASSRWPDRTSRSPTIPRNREVPGDDTARTRRSLAYPAPSSGAMVCPRGCFAAKHPGGTHAGGSRDRRILCLVFRGETLPRVPATIGSAIALFFCPVFRGETPPASATHGYMTGRVFGSVFRGETPLQHLGRASTRAARRPGRCFAAKHRAERRAGGRGGARDSTRGRALAAPVAGAVPRPAPSRAGSARGSAPRSTRIATRAPAASASPARPSPRQRARQPWQGARQPWQSLRAVTAPCDHPPPLA